MSARKAKIVWSTVQFVGPLVPVVAPALEARPPRPPAKVKVPSGPPRLVVEDGISRPDRRGRSPIARLLAGASTKAKANGVLYGHDRICARLEPGVATLAYALGLAGVAMSPKDRWSSRGAYVIGFASAELERQG